MVERNAPCPCGSGKKYKKCCAQKENGAQEQLVEAELSHVIMSYPERLFSDRGHLDAIEEMVQQWQSKLGQYLSSDQIEGLVFDYYIFVKQREQWNRHVVKVMNGTIRSTTRSTLAQWHQPIVLVGRVIGEQGDYYEVEEVLGHQTFMIRKDAFHNTVQNDIIIAIVFRDTREIDNGLYFFNEVMGIHDRNGEMLQRIQQLAESSEAPNLTTFFDEYMLEVYHLIINREEASVQQFTDDELTENEQAVCNHLKKQLEALAVPPMQIEVGQMITISYLRGENPTFRKPEVIAAAVFKAMENCGLVEFTYYFTQKEVADLFNVSVASMAKHIEPIENILEFMMDELDEEESFVGGSTAAYYIGTDPLLTERVNWEIVCRMETLETDSVEELQLLINQKANERFIPKGKAQKAQVYAYDAYEQEDDDARVRLAQVAYATDANNVDALLLKAERAETMNAAKRDYGRAIALGELTFDGDFADSPWGLVTNRPFMRALFVYGVFLFEHEQFEEALGYFEQLLEMNPNDNQGARHLAIAAAIHDGQYPVANRLQQQFKERPIDQAVYRYLEWLLDVKKGRESDLLGEALALNDQVVEIIKENLPRYPYPQEMSIVPGSIEEAFYISFLLWPSGERSF